MQDDPRNFQKFKKMPLILSLVLLLGSCAIYFFVYKEINDNRQLSKEAQAQWQNEANRRNQIESIDRSLQEVEGQKNLLETHFAQSSDVVPFLDSIGDIARSVGIDSEVVSVDIAKDKSGLLVEVKASGSFTSVYKFLMLLENSAYELDFLSVDLRKFNGKTDWDSDFKIKLLSFIQ